jgi:superfamily II DNA or RNA helicase
MARQKSILKIAKKPFGLIPEGKMSLRPYQVPHYGKFLQSLQKRRYVFDGSDTGTGKTYVALEACKALDVVPLVVGPKAAQGGWEAASETIGVPLEFIGYEKLRGQRKKETKYGTGLIDSEYLIERPMGKGSQLNWKQIPDTVIFDEVHRCSGLTSLASKALIAAKRQANRIIALSATAADDPRQMKALGYALDLHGLSRKAFNKTDYIGWLLRHGCTPGWAGSFDFTRNSEKGEKAFRLMHAEIFGSGKGVRMRKDEIPGFPKTTIDVQMLMPDDQAAEIAAELHELNKHPDCLEEIVAVRQALEELKVPALCGLAADYALTSKVVIFVNYTATLKRLQRELPSVLPNGLVDVIWGQQTESERWFAIKQFQANKLDALVVNAQAGGEAFNAHDPTGKVERTSLICPMDSGRRYVQVTGRVHRDGGARSQQYLVFFKGTYEEKVAQKMLQKGMNVELFNDADLLV